MKQKMSLRKTLYSLLTYYRCTVYSTTVNKR